MRVDIIEDMPGFQRLREDWNAVYDADPVAHFFVSWQWLASYLGSLRGPWLILAARPSESAAYVAFFPLRLRTKERGDRREFYNEIIMGGSYWADYTGFICRPQEQEAAIVAFANQIKKLNWAYLMLDNIRASDGRLERLLQFFPEKRFEIKPVERLNKIDNIDNCICPYVSLPDKWDDYVGSLGSNTRQKMRRFLRQLDGSEQLRVTHATRETIERDLGIVLQFWRIKWAARKGSRIDTLVSANRANLMAAFENGQLFLPLLWDGERPIGGLASLIDPKKRALLFYLGARDESINSPPPGFLLHAYSLRYAITQGLRTYDFLRGNESYKYMFNVREERIQCFEVSTRTKRNLGGRLDRRSLPVLLQRAALLHKAGRLADAEHGYRQALLINGQCTHALAGLGQLMQDRGSHSETIKLYRSLVSLLPDNVRAWSRLGKSYYARRQFLDAIDCYEEALRRQPQSPTVNYALGLALIKIGDGVGAFGALERALDCAPHFALAQEKWLKLVGSLGGSSPEKCELLALFCDGRAKKSAQEGAPGFASQCQSMATGLMSHAAHAGREIDVVLQ